MVLATDMTKHFEHVSKFNNMAGKATIFRDEDNLSIEVSYVFFSSIYDENKMV